MSNRASNEPTGTNNYEFYVLTHDGAYFVLADYVSDDFSQGAKLYVYNNDPNAKEKASLVAWFQSASMVLRNPTFGKEKDTCRRRSEEDFRGFR